MFVEYYITVTDVKGKISVTAQMAGVLTNAQGFSRVEGFWPGRRLEFRCPVTPCFVQELRRGTQGHGDAAEGTRKCNL
jgi:hypothetical protein